MLSNIEKLELAVQYLGKLTNKVVFIGGCSTGILITDLAAPAVRVTLDVDVITDVDSLIEYYKLQEELRSKGFSEDSTSGAPICRYQKGDLILDVMPANPKILGFGNEWFKPALDSALPVTLPSGKEVLMISAPYFLACKLEAFKGRGRGDYLMSHDMEDIISVIDGRQEIEAEVAKSDEKLRSYLSFCFSEILKDDRFLEALPGLLPGDEGAQGRIPIIISRVKFIVDCIQE